jgi:hypothetical protein
VDSDPFDELRAALGARLDDDDPNPRRRRRLLTLAVVGIGLVSSLVLASALAPEPHADGSDAAPVALAGGAEVPAVESAPATSGPERVWPPAEPVEILGTEVRARGQRWQVGIEGDLVAVGDWDCDGSPTPAVLRPSAGRLHVFDGWAEGDGELVASPGPTAPLDAVSVEPSGCGQAVVRTAAGGTVVLDTRGVGR